MESELELEKRFKLYYQKQMGFGQDEIKCKKKEHTWIEVEQMFATDGKERVDKNMKREVRNKTLGKKFKNNKNRIKLCNDVH